MPTTIINLKAGKATRQSFAAARFLLLQDLGVAPSVDVDIEINGFAKEHIEGLHAGEQVQTPGFTACSFTAPVDCSIKVLASVADVRVNTTEGATVNANILGTVPVNVAGPDPLPVSIAGPNPLPVAATRGDAPANPFYVSGQVLGDTPASSGVDNAAKAVAAADVKLLDADATRLEVIFYNIGPDPVALGMPGIAWAKRAIVLQAGDTWIESRLAAMEWHAINDVGTNSSVTTQERKA